MNVVLFLSGQNVESAIRLHRVAAATVPPSCLESIYSYERLALRLRNAPRNIALVILFALDAVQLDRLVALEPFLENVLTIVVLPDRKPDTVARGLRLRPRWLTDTDSDFSDLTPFLWKWMEPDGAERPPLAQQLDAVF